jgi:hypothetical protein
MTIEGVGFPEKWPNTHYNKASLKSGDQSYPIKFKSISPNSVTFFVPPGFDAQTYKFALVTPTGSERIW